MYQLFNTNFHEKVRSRKQKKMLRDGLPIAARLGIDPALKLGDLRLRTTKGARKLGACRSGELKHHRILFETRHVAPSLHME